MSNTGVKFSRLLGSVQNHCSLLQTVHLAAGKVVLDDTSVGRSFLCGSSALNVMDAVAEYGMNLK